MFHLRLLSRRAVAGFRMMAGFLSLSVSSPVCLEPSSGGLEGFHPKQKTLLRVMKDWESCHWLGVSAIQGRSSGLDSVSVTGGHVAWGPYFRELQKRPESFGFSSSQGGAKNSIKSASWSWPSRASTPSCSWGESVDCLVIWAGILWKTEEEKIIVRLMSLNFGKGNFLFLAVDCGHVLLLWTSS